LRSRRGGKSGEGGRLRAQEHRETEGCGYNYRHVCLLNVQYELWNATTSFQIVGYIILKKEKEKEKKKKKRKA
jgi:hypothetical protein